MYFYALFYPYIIPKNTNNIIRNLLPNGLSISPSHLASLVAQECIPIQNWESGIMVNICICCRRLAAEFFVVAANISNKHPRL